MPAYLRDLQQLSASLCPDLRSIILHESEITHSTWETDFETGKAVEIYTLCTLAAALTKLGKTVTIPEVYFKNPDLFYLRNILHRHHGAQAGHAGADERISLKDRFLSALTPRLIFKEAALFYGVYREGFPIHLIQTLRKGGSEYLDRPDLLIIEGNMEISNDTHDEVRFTYTTSIGEATGVLRIKNDINIPIKSYEHHLPNGLPIVGIIECSVGKSNIRAEEQLSKYIAIFGSATKPATLLVNGKKKKCAAYDFESWIDLTVQSLSDSNSSLLATMVLFVEKALASKDKRISA